MLIYVGGGWTLVVTISSKSSDHFQGAEVHCFKPKLCIPFVEEKSDIAARKLADKDIHEMMHFEGKAVSWIKGQSFNKRLKILLFGSDYLRTFSDTLQCYQRNERRFQW